MVYIEIIDWVEVRNGLLWRCTSLQSCKILSEELPLPALSYLKSLTAGKFTNLSQMYCLLVYFAQIGLSNIQLIAQIYAIWLTFKIHYDTWIEVKPIGNTYFFYFIVLNIKFDSQSNRKYLNNV